MRFLLLFAFILTFFSCERELAVIELDQKVPNYTFTGLLNSEEQSLTLSDLKGKTVILEFWAAWCSPCIPAMKKLDSLQTEFGDKLEVIAVSGDSKERLQKFINNTKSGLRMASDTSHQELFKYKTIPHAVVIDKEGIVRAITSPGNISREVLNNLMDKNEISLPVKDDFYVDTSDVVQTLASVNADGYRIELMTYEPGKRGSSRVLKNTEGEVNGIKMTNSTIPRLFQTLLKVSSPNRMLFQEGLSEKDFPYQKDHQYSMLVEVSEEYGEEWRQLGLDFLNEHFDANARVTEVPLDCYVLTKTDDKLPPSEAVEMQFMFMGTSLMTSKIKINRLVGYLENFSDLPVVDQTGLLGEYDINLEWQEENPESIHTALEALGLKLERSEKPLPVEVMEIFRKED
jgi:peroxiredoxin